MVELSSLFEVSIDFDQSHLYFPRLILSLLVGMLVVIALVHRQRLLQILRNPRQELHFFEPNADKLRLFFTIGFVLVYLYAMDLVGGFFPNQGLGFLVCSIVFIFILATVYAHERSRRVMTIISCVAVIAPLLAWYVLGKLFAITLP